MAEGREGERMEGDEEEVRGQETKMLVTSVTPELEDFDVGAVLLLSPWPPTTLKPRRTYICFLSSVYSSKTCSALPLCA
jgi:hypothetical protein